RFDGAVPFEMLKRMAVLAPYVVGTQLALLRIFGAHKFAWRYVGLREVSFILTLLSAGAAFFISVRLLAAHLLPHVGHAIYFVLPIGVILIDLCLAFLGISGVRIVRRLIAERSERAYGAELRRQTPSKRTLLVG